MKKAIVRVTLALPFCAALLAFAYGTTDYFFWNRYAPASAEFSVEVPGKPLIPLHTWKTRNISMLFYTFFTAPGQTRLTVTEVVYSSDAMKTEYCRKNIATLIEQLSICTPGHKLYERDFVFDSVPAREIAIRAGDGHISRSRFLYWGNRLFLLSASGPEEDRHKLDRFFGSFRVHILREEDFCSVSSGLSR